MEYLALYRKYRPDNLDDVVGQCEIKQILANSVVNGTITHAYLFSGPRGTGKTTLAKILAKMVNCLSPIDGNACNKCQNCLNILKSNDVIEIDAASNNGVDEIRDLREKASLVPSSGKYKVYIIDEVHMLTTQAFNALLKTLEEPPKHVIFILATTEYHKIPLTITSRCQKFQFNKIDDNLIISRLRKISDLENVDITDEALKEIATISDGGMRDSINFLDQIRSFKVGKIEISDVYGICGNVPVNEITNLFLDVKNNDVEKITIFFENMSVCGKNFNKFFEDVLDFFKDVILYKKGASTNIIRNDSKCLNQVSSLYSIDDIFLVVESINKIMEQIKFVSRQSVFIIANFLMLAHKINGIQGAVINHFEQINSGELVNVNLLSNSVQEENKLTASNDLIKNSESLKNDFNVLNKDILINNTFAVADKSIKNSLQKKYLLIKDYLTDKKYASIAGLLIDTSIEVAGAGYLILTANYDNVIDGVNKNYKLCCEFLNCILDEKYNFVVITSSEWEKYKKEYIENSSKGKKYILEPLDDRIIDVDILEKEPTIVDKLFELVGEESIEFK